MFDSSIAKYCRQSLVKRGVVSGCYLLSIELKGEPFTVKVQVGDQVTPGTLLAEMDLAKVKAAGKKTAVVVVMTNSEKMDRFILTKQGDSKTKTPIGEFFIYQ